MIYSLRRFLSTSLQQKVFLIPQKVFEMFQYHVGLPHAVCTCGEPCAPSYCHHFRGPWGQHQWRDRHPVGHPIQPH